MNYGFCPKISKVLSGEEGEPDQGTLYIGDFKSSYEDCLKEFNVKAVVSAIKGVTIKYDKTKIVHTII